MTIKQKKSMNVYPSPPTSSQPKVSGFKNWLNDENKLKRLAIIQTVLVVMALIPNEALFFFIVDKSGLDLYALLYWATFGVVSWHYWLDEVVFGLVRVISGLLPAIALVMAAIYSVKSITRIPNRKRNLLTSVVICLGTTFFEITVLYQWGILSLSQDMFLPKFLSWPVISLGVAIYYSVKGIRNSRNRKKNLLISAIICAGTVFCEGALVLISAILDILE